MGAHPAACPYCGSTVVNQVQADNQIRPARLNDDGSITVGDVDHGVDFEGPSLLFCHGCSSTYVQPSAVDEHFDESLKNDYEGVTAPSKDEPGYIGRGIRWFAVPQAWEEPAPGMYFVDVRFMRSRDDDLEFAKENFPRWYHEQGGERMFGRLLLDQFAYELQGVYADHLAGFFEVVGTSLDVEQIDVSAACKLAIERDTARNTAQPPMWTHEFHVPIPNIPQTNLRPGQEWLRDTLDAAEFKGQYAEATAFVANLAEPGDQEWVVTIEGTEAVLRFCSVLFSQEPERLEATLAQAVVPVCPNCGASAHWSADVDVTNRAMVRLAGEVLIDRAGPEGTSISQAGLFTCEGCGYVVSDDQDLYKVLWPLAQHVVTDEDRRWRVIHGYTEV